MTKKEQNNPSSELGYNILRGKGTIGNLIEITFGKVKLLLECGKELDEEPASESEIEKQILQTKYDAILVSHYHLDHAGLVSNVKGKIYMGKGCFEVLSSQQKYLGKRQPRNVVCFQPNEEFVIENGADQIKVKPILVDHSAYDSYMFLIFAGEKTLLYTGDFRSNGRKSFSAVLNSLPSKVDYLICEATNMFSGRRNI